MVREKRRHGCELRESILGFMTHQCLSAYKMDIDALLTFYRRLYPFRSIFLWLNQVPRSNKAIHTSRVCFYVTTGRCISSLQLVQLTRRPQEQALVLSYQPVSRLVPYTAQGYRVFTHLFSAPLYLTRHSHGTRSPRQSGRFCPSFMSSSSTSNDRR